MNRASRFLLFLLPASAVIFATSADAIVRRDDVADQEYIDFGALFPSVGKLERSNGGIEGSGVLIDSRWVLTAAHLNPAQVDFAGTLYTSEEFITHPDWTGDVNDGNDIALMKLSSSVTGVTPSSRYTGTDELGQVGVSVGFGNRGTGETGEISGTAGTKRAAESTIERFGSNAPVTSPATVFESDFFDPTNSAVLDLEGLPVTRDSGGPVFLNMGSAENPDYVVGGIHSFIMNSGGALGTYGDTLGSTRVSDYDEWITATIPEPSTWAALLGLGALGFTIILRRSQV